MNNATILVIDDKKEYLTLIKNILEEGGYKNVLSLVIRTKKYSAHER